MSIFAYWHSLAAKLFHGSRVEAEMEDELRSHIQYRADDLERSGLPRAEAERRARVEFGGHGRFKEECQDALGGSLLESLLQDVRYSLRALRKSPGFSLVSITTLATAIAANAVVFGILNGLILRPLDIPHAENLYGTIYGEDPGWQSYPNYRDLRERNRSFDDLAAFSFAFVGLDTGHDPASATGFATSGNYFDVLGIRPHLGRFFHASDEHGPSSAPYLVLSYAYWHSRFFDDPRVIGRVVEVNKHPFTIIGVAQPGFRGTLFFISPDFFLPIVNQVQLEGENLLDARANTQVLFETFGHLKAGVTRAQALADVNSVGAYLSKTYPKGFSQKSSSLGHPGLTAFDNAVRAFLTGLTLLAGLILLAACANLGGLFAARAADRSREVALRLALGSSRSRIVRGLLTEAVLISLAGGAVGLGCSILLLQSLSQWQPFPGAPIHLPVTPDARVYFIAVILALISGFLFGMTPVRQVLKTDPYNIVKAGTRTTGERRVALRDVLLAAQIAICAVLVTSSAVAVRGLMRSLHADLGFASRNTLLVGTNLATAGYKIGQVPVMQKRMLAALAATPGIEHVGLINGYPPLAYASAHGTNVFKETTVDLSSSNVASTPYRYEASPDYFRAVGTKFLAGRDFNWHDDKNAGAVAIVNRTFASQLFGSPVQAVGGHVKLQDGTRVEIVGVVETGKYLSVTENPHPAIFLFFLGSPTSQSYLIVRSKLATPQIASAVRSKLHDLDPGLPMDTQTWNTMLEVALFPARVATLALGVLGALGAMLSVTGIFGMAAYTVSKRLKELGVRMALGAQRKQVLQAALGRPLRLLTLGSVAGLALGILASRVLASIVYQATPRDPVVLTAAVVAMASLGLIATWIPAQRALSLDPIKLLRED